MPPHEVLERFTEGEMVHMIAYENLYGQLGPERLDTLFARLGMDVVSPHMKKGKKPKIEDHLLKWGVGSRKKKMTPDQMLASAKSIQAAFEQANKKSDKQKTSKRQERRGQRRPQRPQRRPQRNRSVAQRSQDEKR